MGFLWTRDSSADVGRDRGTRDLCVRCPTCSFEIRLASGLRLPEEFSALCPNCGQRKVYRSAEVHDAALAAGAAPRRTEFGKKTAH